MIVVDASAVLDALLPTSRGAVVEAVLRSDPGPALAPDLIDAEVTSALRRLVLAGIVDPARARAVRGDLAGLRIARRRYHLGLDRAWALRENFALFDALYVALAENAGASLLTTDDRLGAATSIHTAVPLALPPAG